MSLWRLDVVRAREGDRIATDGKRFFGLHRSKRVECHDRGECFNGDVDRNISRPEFEITKNNLKVRAIFPANFYSYKMGILGFENNCSKNIDRK